MKHFSTGGEIPCIHLCSHICLSKGSQSKKYSLVSFVVLRSPFNYRLIDHNTTHHRGPWGILFHVSKSEHLIRDYVILIG